MIVSTTLLAKSAVGALAGTGLVTASVLGLHTGPSAQDGAIASVADKTHSAKGAAQCRRLGLRVGKAPEALKDDLKAARKQLHDSDATGEAKAAQRREARDKIKAGIEDGTYGKELQQRAQRREAAAAKHRAALPEKLRSDLDALKKLDPGTARREAAEKIRKARLDGTYGAEVEQRAEKHQRLVEQRKSACADQREERREKRQAEPGAASEQKGSGATQKSDA